jgi:hypothetical protein
MKIIIASIVFLSGIFAQAQTCRVYVYNKAVVIESVANESECKALFIDFVSIEDVPADAKAYYVYGAKSSTVGLCELVNSNQNVIQSWVSDSVKSCKAVCENYKSIEDQKGSCYFEGNSIFN